MTIKSAKFWQHSGCSQQNGGYPVELISALAFLCESKMPCAPLTSEDLAQIKVMHGSPIFDLGRVVMVSAPEEVWERGRQALALALEEFLAEEIR